MANEKQGEDEDAKVIDALVGRIASSSDEGLKALALPLAGLAKRLREDSKPQGVALLRGFAIVVGIVLAAAVGFWIRLRLHAGFGWKIETFGQMGDALGPLAGLLSAAAVLAALLSVHYQRKELEENRREMRAQAKHMEDAASAQQELARSQKKLASATSRTATWTSRLVRAQNRVAKAQESANALSGTAITAQLAEALATVESAYFAGFTRVGLEGDRNALREEYIKAYGGNAPARLHNNIHQLMKQLEAWQHGAVDDVEASASDAKGKK